MEDSTKTLLEVNHLSFRYESELVLDDINMNINQGDFVGLVGPNGSGKSTLVRVLLGLHKHYQGEVRWFGTPVRQFHQWPKIGYVSQKANRFNAGFPVTVYEVVAMGLYGKKGLLRFLNRKDKQRIHEALEQVDMLGYKKKNMGRLSGGQQQRVFIARALVSDPEVLILDEPTVGVDAASAQAFYERLSHWNREKGITLILVTHDVGAMTKYVTKVACLNQQLHFHGTTREFEESDLAGAYGHDVHIIHHEHDHHAGGA
ncbi:metal ABC transporter ATP-binding protein [Marinococcus halotolerans]|uniref:metal ABC transporter ATP-binding protein n=1 Tax=Marinococcus halotolerans TaxID=301092 RepID=UPI0003B75650|nr:metal ABC transporter ATP-binding protein [Marinococcus halotolerans]